MNTRNVIILAVVVFGIVAAAFLFLQSSPPPASLPEVAPPAPLARAATPAPAPRPGAAPAARQNNSVAALTRNAPAPAPLTEWEEKIERVLSSQGTETETAQQMINLLPSLPPEGQAEAAQHITNLITDKDYNRVLPLLRNAGLPEEVQDVLVTDLMNRDDPVKLPALLDVAKMSNHPHHEEALNDLQIFLDVDDGQNWAKWDTDLKAYLKKQATEEAAEIQAAAAGK